MQTTTSPTAASAMLHADVECMPRDRLASLQVEKLSRVLRTAYDNVRHYRQAFDKAGVTPSDLKEIADLAKFPFTVK